MDITQSLTLEVRHIDNAMSAGLRQEWLKGGADDVTFNLSCGAGLGSPYLILAVTVDGVTKYSLADLREFVPAWVDSLADAIKAEVAK